MKILNHSKVDRNPREFITTLTSCWVWRGAATPAGYGVLRVGTKNQYVHRLAMTEHIGRKLKKGELVCHRCDNPICLRPSHLFLSDQAGNIRDALSKGRMDLSGLEKGRGWMRDHPETRLIGANNPNSKLNARKVRQARRWYFRGMTQRAIAKKLGVAQPTIGRLLLRKTWKHVE